MNLFQRYLVDEFAEDYSEGRMSRRQALKMISSITGSLVVANSILAACAPPPQEAPLTQPSATSQPAATTEPPRDTPPVETTPSQPMPTATSTEAATPPADVPAYGTVSPDDPAIEAGQIEFPGDGAALQAYLAQPRDAGPSPVILVCHENRGLTDHIRDVARRLAKAGYVALAVDLLSRQGGTGSLASSDVPGALGNIPPDQFVQDFVSGWRYLQDQSFAQTDRLGMTGFCFGGGVTWRAATQMPELKVAVPFYGPHPPLEDVPNISAAVLAIYGEQDQRINQGIAEIEAAMQQNDKIYAKIIYPNADHAFFNDTGSRYNPEAAQDAWTQMLSWFSQYV